MPKPSAKDVELYADLTGKFKKIEDYTDDELNAVINVIGNADNYKLLNFIDAYFERRRRRALSGK